MIQSIEGFERASINTKPVIIMSVTGTPGEGKTHFSLTAPGPIAVQNIDIGLKHVVDKFVDYKLIFASKYAIAINLKSISKTISRKQNEQATRSALNIDIDTVIQEWERFKKDYIRLLSHPEIKTIVWDTGSEVWQLIRAARFGKLDMVEGHMYGPVNMEMNYLVKMAFEHDKNFIVLHKMKDEYKDKTLASGGTKSYRTGNKVRDGFGNMDHLVEITTFVHYNRSNKQFELTIDKCRPNPGLTGEVLSGECCDFRFLASLIYPDIDPATWEG
jgi:hypothetical protein